MEPARGARLEQALARGAGHGLLCLGADEVGTTLPPTLSYWRKLEPRYVTAFALPGIDERSKRPVPIAAAGGLDTMVAAAPPMTGAAPHDVCPQQDLWCATCGIHSIF